MIEYEVVDFKGKIAWIRFENGKYAVDPLYLKEFLHKVKE